MFPKLSDDLWLIDGQLTRYHNWIVTYFSEAYHNDSIGVLGTHNEIMIFDKSSLHMYPFDTHGRLKDIQVFKGNILTARGHGLYLIDLAQKQENPIYECDYEITCCRVFGDYIFIGTKGDGILVFKDHSVIDQIQFNSETARNIINDIEIIQLNEIWVGTNQGVARLSWSPSKSKIENFTNIDGLPKYTVNDIQVLNQEVWMATAYGVIRFNRAIQKKSAGDQPVFFRKLFEKVNGTKGLDLMDLSYDQNEIELYFDAVSFIPDVPITYRYKINGDTNWSYTQSKNISLKSIAPGNYTITVQTGIDGEWNSDTVSYQINIAEPFYKTYWFLSLVALFVLLAFYAFFKLNILKYNRHITREILRQLLRRLSLNKTSFIIVDGGNRLRIKSSDILFARSARNYLEIYCVGNQKHLVRMKISDFQDLVPDKLEYLRIHRSYIIRIDKITSFNAKDRTVTIGQETIKIGKLRESETQRLAEIFQP